MGATRALVTIRRSAGDTVYINDRQQAAAFLESLDVSEVGSVAGGSPSSTESESALHHDVTMRLEAARPALTAEAAGDEAEPVHRLRRNVALHPARQAVAGITGENIFSADPRQLRRWQRGNASSTVRARLDAGDAGDDLKQQSEAIMQLAARIAVLEDSACVGHDADVAGGTPADPSKVPQQLPIDLDTVVRDVGDKIVQEMVGKIGFNSVVDDMSKLSERITDSEKVKTLAETRITVMTERFEELAVIAARLNTKVTVIEQEVGNHRVAALASVQQHVQAVLDVEARIADLTTDTEDLKTNSDAIASHIIRLSTEINNLEIEVTKNHFTSCSQHPPDIVRRVIPPPPPPPPQGWAKWREEQAQRDDLKDMQVAQARLQVAPVPTAGSKGTETDGWS